MRQHVVIRREEYVVGTSGRPDDMVFMQTHATRHPVPWGRIAVGEPVWMKWTGGPIVATGKVERFQQIEHCTPDKLRAAVKGYGRDGRGDYWSSLPPQFSAMVIYVGEQRWLDPPITPSARSYGGGWVVLDDAQSAGAWLTDAEPVGGVNVLTEAGGEVRLGRGSRAVRPALRFEVFRRDGFKCVYCGRAAPEFTLQVDHCIPWSAGGTTTLDNLRTACSECNRGKGGRIIDPR